MLTKIPVQHGKKKQQTTKKKNNLQRNSQNIKKIKTPGVKEILSKSIYILRLFNSYILSFSLYFYQHI